MNSMYPKKSTVPETTRKSSSPSHAAVATPARRIQVRRSGVHGKGVYAQVAFAPGDTIVEYKGELISWDEAQRRHPHDPADPNHTFYFHINSGDVIDGGVNGNAARWINHACDPNCETDEAEGRVFIKALKPIAAGDELFYDYRLMLEERHTPKVKKEYACLCGSPRCRGSMLAPKRGTR